mgnify:CR=1 FL=1
MIVFDKNEIKGDEDELEEMDICLGTKTISCPYAVAFYDKALASGVAYVAGEFFHPDRSGKNTMRLNFSFMSPEKIIAGIKLLAGLLADGMDSRSGRE